MATKKAKWLTVDPKEVLQVNKQKVMLLFGQPITEIELKNLKEEVKALKMLRIWRIFQETLKHEAIKQGFVEAENWEMTLSGKMMLHSLGIMQSITDAMAIYQAPAVKK